MNRFQSNLRRILNRRILSSINNKAYKSLDLIRDSSLQLREIYHLRTKNQDGTELDLKRNRPEIGQSDLNLNQSKPRLNFKKGRDSHHQRRDFFSKETLINNNKDNKFLNQRMMIDKRIRPTDSNKTICPPNEIEITFLGTSAGKPTVRRNPSSLALRLDGTIWMFDCGEATTHQIMRTTLKPSNVSKIFITHLHGDHVLGLISFLSHIGDRPDADHSSHIHDKLSVPTNLVEVYGPSGIREYIRSNLRLTQTHSPLRIKVNELLRRNRDQIYGPSLSHTNGPNRLWHSEVLGEDIWCDEQGLWKDVVRLEECGVSVSAAPIQHTIDCVGYFLKESNRREKFDMAKLNPILKEHSEEIKKMGFKVLPAILSELEKTRNPVTFSTGVTIHPPKLSVQGRKVIILGDTSNPGPILSLLDLKDDERVDLLVHESTGTSISELDCKTEESEGSVSRRMRERGHSTSLMAGKFARRCKAKRLILNHLGGKFPAPLGCLCPDEAILAELPHYSHSLRVQHASLWKSFEELKPAQREKIKTELVWIRSVEDDALKGWREGTTNVRREEPSRMDIENVKQDDESSDLKKEEELKVTVAHDFMKFKIIRNDLS